MRDATYDREFAAEVSDGLTYGCPGRPCWSIYMPSDPDMAVAAIRFIQEHCGQVEIETGESYGCGVCVIRGFGMKITKEALLASIT